MIIETALLKILNTGLEGKVSSPIGLGCAFGLGGGGRSFILIVLF